MLLCLYNYSVLPPEGLGVHHPLTLGTERLFDDVTPTAVASLTVADVDGDVLDLRTGILWTDRTTHASHDLQIWDVVTHIHHLIVRKAVLGKELFIGLNFHGAGDIDILHTKSIITVAHTFDFGARHDGNPQSELHSQLYGIPVLDIHRPLRHTVISHRDGLSTQHPVDIEDDCLDLIQIIINHFFREYLCDLWLKLIQVYVLPLEFVLTLWLTLVSPTTDGEDAETGEILGDVENATDDSIGRGAVVETTTTHLNPA